MSGEYSSLIGKRMEEDDANAVFQAMRRNAAYAPNRFGVGLPTLPNPIPDAPLRESSRQMRPEQRPVYGPNAFYPDDEDAEIGS